MIDKTTNTLHINTDINSVSLKQPHNTIANLKANKNGKACFDEKVVIFQFKDL